MCDAASIALCPTIFQEPVPKAYEIRITSMGAVNFAYKIKSQEHIEGTVDWRNIPLEELEIEPCVLPDRISRFCTDYLMVMKLRFGCFDFIVTPEGEYVFLELNQQGQFVWKEYRCPEVPLLGYFIQFLIGGAKFDWAPSKTTISAIELLKSSEFSERMKMDPKLHVAASY